MGWLSAPWSTPSSRWSLTTTRWTPVSAGRTWSWPSPPQSKTHRSPAAAGPPRSPRCRVFQEAGRLPPAHRGGRHVADGRQTGPHVRLHICPGALQPSEDVWMSRSLMLLELQSRKKNETKQKTAKNSTGPNAAVSLTPFSVYSAIIHRWRQESILRSCCCWSSWSNTFTAWNCKC